MARIGCSAAATSAIMQKEIKRWMKMDLDPAASHAPQTHKQAEDAINPYSNPRIIQIVGAIIGNVAKFDKNTTQS